MSSRVRRGRMFHCNHDNGNLMPLYVTCWTWGVDKPGKGWGTYTRIRPGGPYPGMTGS